MKSLSHRWSLGKAFSCVAFIQNLDVVVGTIACTETYRASISFFSGLVFIFAAATRFVALILIVSVKCASVSRRVIFFFFFDFRIQASCVNRTPYLALITPIDDSEDPLIDTETQPDPDAGDDDDDDRMIYS